MRSALYFLSLTAMTALSSPALAGVINLPQTGQTIQAAAGDDGGLLKGAVWPASRFTVNPDQTVSDSLSGLVWNSNGNTHTPTGQCGVSGTNRTWSDALAYVACLNSSVYLGFTDWRLPTVTELGTLPSAGQPDSAAWLNSQGFSAVQSSFYWSSTSDASAPADFAWSVQLSSGATFSDDKTATFPVIAVRRGPVAEPLPLYPANNRRSGQVVSIAAGDDGALLRGVSWPAARFTLQSTGSGVVNDNLTRLVWLQDAGTPTVAACSGGPVSWTQALAYVDCLNGINYQGRSDWRLPNRAELESLVDYSASGPALPAVHPFTNLAGSLWSSTSDAADASNSAWYLTLFDGSLFSTLKSSAINVVPVSGPDATATAPSRAASLPRTGQTVTVSAGDDGALQNGYPWPANRFSDNGQSLTDTLTGLEWSKDADAPPAGAVTCRSLNGADMTWQEALSYVACLNSNSFLGHNDWRLPAVNELESLTNAGSGDGQASLEALGFTTVKNDYWASTTDVAGLAVPADAAWSVRMTFGEVFSLTKDTLLSAWPVRAASVSAPAVPWQSGQTLCYNEAGATIACAATGQDGHLRPGIAWPEARFTANGDQTATDQLTGLVWPSDAGTPTVGSCIGGILSWIDSMSYVACLNTSQYLGHNDWRLPNRKELRSLISYGDSQPALPVGHPFSAVSGYYWSSTGKSGDPTTSLAINLAFADQSEFKSDNLFAALPVRGGQNVAADKGYLDFGTPDLNTAVVIRSVTVTNRGSVHLTVGSATLSGPDTAMFVIGPNSCSGANLSPGGSCSVTVSFNPSAEGFKEGALTVVSSDPDTGSLRLPISASVPDRRVPLVTLSSPLAGFTNKRDKVLDFTASDGYVRVFMNGTLISKVSGEALPLLLDGANTIRVEATDVSGNTGFSEAIITFVQPIGELDGVPGVTIADALNALRIAVNLLPQPTGQLLFSGDVAPLVNGVPEPNGIIDLSDALIILRKIVGLENF